MVICFFLDLHQFLLLKLELDQMLNPLSIVKAAQVFDRFYLIDF